MKFFEFLFLHIKTIFTLSIFIMMINRLHISNYFHNFINTFLEDSTVNFIVSNFFFFFIFFIFKVTFDLIKFKKSVFYISKNIQRKSRDLSPVIMNRLQEVLKDNNININKLKDLKFFHNPEIEGYSIGNHIYINENNYDLNNSIDVNTAVGILLHEIKHYKNKDILKEFIFGRVLVVFNSVLFLFMLKLHYDFNFIIILSIMLFFIFISFLLIKKYSRILEEEADKFSFKLLKNGLINYLIKQNNNFSFIRTLFMEHPNTKDRLKNYRVFAK